MPKTPPHPKAPRRCAFCDYSGRLSREHIWPAWFRKFVSRGTSPAPRTNHQSTWNSMERDNLVTAVWTRAKLARPGELADQRLRIVCKKCNETWMSGLQNAAKPILGRLAVGDWSVPLDEPMQLCLASWAVMFTMTLEFADELTIAISEDERERFRLRTEFPANSYVLIGRNDGSPADFFHRGLSLYSAATPPSVAPRCNVQVSTFLFGSVVFQVFTGHAPAICSADFSADMAKYGPSLALQPIWPIRHPVVSRPAYAVANFLTVATSLSNELLQIDPNWVGRVPPAPR